MKIANRTQRQPNSNGSKVLHQDHQVHRPRNTKKYTAEVKDGSIMPAETKKRNRDKGKGQDVCLPIGEGTGWKGCDFPSCTFAIEQDLNTINQNLSTSSDPKRSTICRKKPHMEWVTLWAQFRPVMRKPWLRSELRNTYVSDQYKCIRTSVFFSSNLPSKLQECMCTHSSSSLEQCAFYHFFY